MTYQPIDQKKEDFRKYLEKNGVIENLTRAFVGLYEEADKPENPLEYLRQLMLSSGNASDLLTQIDQLKAENSELKQRIQDLEQELVVNSGGSGSNSGKVVDVVDVLLEEDENVVGENVGEDEK